MSKLGRGRMPHIGSEIVDEQGVRLLHDWIQSLPLHEGEQTLIERLRTVERPPRSGRGRRLAGERTAAINQLLGSTSSALQLAEAIADHRIPDAVRTEIVTAAMARPEPQIRDLFERFVPDDQRVKRLGSVIKPEQILSLKGDAARGKELFFKTAGLQCVNCHAIAGKGSALGPDLTEIGKKYTQAQLLESILEPSKSIDPKYVSYLLETTDGQVHTGLLAEKTATEVVLKIVGDKEVRVPASKVASLVPQKTSLMPEQLLRDLTAEQAADLVAFLASLR